MNSVLNSPCFKVEDQQKHNLSGSLQKFRKVKQLNLNILGGPDMSSVSNLKGAPIEKIGSSYPPTQLLNSPTFNTLDNRFVTATVEHNHFMIGGSTHPMTHSPSANNDKNVNQQQQYFAESNWVSHVQSPLEEMPETVQTDEAAPRMASPAGFDPIDDDDNFDEESKRPLLASLLTFETNKVTQLEPFSIQGSLTSNAQRSDKSKRAQPCQQKASLSKNVDSVSKKGSISPQRQSCIKTPEVDIKFPTARSKRSTPYRKNRMDTAEQMANDGILKQTLNMISSDTFKENSPYNMSMKNHSRTQQHARNKTHDGYKKMNKEPTQDRTVKLGQIGKTTNNELKHSAYQVSRTRVPSIGHKIEVETDFNRLNLKTREENMSKRNQLMQRAVEARDSFDISLDFTPKRVETSGMSTLKHRHNLKYGEKHRMKGKDDEKINSKFLKQSEMLHLRPDNFRRISIQTDMEFGGMTQAQRELHMQQFGNSGQSNLQPLSASRVTDTILEQEHGNEDEQSMWGMTEQSASSSLLPKTRHVFKHVKIRETVLKSRNESSRVNDLLSQKNNSVMTPSIHKALKERANFYRRKLMFYEDLDVLAVSMTSNEIQAKLEETNFDIMSNNNSLLNQLAVRCEDSNRPATYTNANDIFSNSRCSTQQKYNTVQQQEFTLPSLMNQIQPTIMSGSSELKDPVDQTDFRPKDMSVRRSRILQTIDPVNSDNNYSTKSKLPKSLPRQKTDHNKSIDPETVNDNSQVDQKQKRKGIRIYDMLIAAKADSVSREYSLPSASNASRPNVPNSRSQFQRVNVSQIEGQSNQVWRRVNNATLLTSIAGDDAPRTTRMPDLTDVRKRQSQPAVISKKVCKKLSSKNAVTSRNVSNSWRTQYSTINTARDTSGASRRDSGIRDVIKDLIGRQQQPVKSLKLKVLEQDKQKKLQLPIKKLKLNNRLKVSPLNQELKKLEPVIITATNGKQLSRRPAFVKYSHREIEAEPPRGVSPDTRADPSKPRLITKAKAQKLKLLQQTINQL